MSWKSFYNALLAGLSKIIAPTVLAAVAMLIDYLLRGKEFSPRDSAAAALVGALLGLAWDLGRELRESLQRLEHIAEGAESRLENIAARAEARLGLVTDLPFAELLRPDAGHIGVLCRLIGDALKSVRAMANVDAGQYLKYLEGALTVSQSYEGIQRFPIRWFRQGAASYYLSQLRDQKMTRKVRLFILEDRFEAEMNADLANPELLEFYWLHTGDVPSYWILESELKTLGLPIVEDCALYDKRLLIQYDESRRVLCFAVGDDPQINNVSKLFSRIRMQEERQGLPAIFKMIPKAQSTKPALPVSSSQVGH